MPRKTKPHPRSLDALFGPVRTVKTKAKPKPKPRRRPIRRCPEGHLQSQSYKAGGWCRLCFEAKREAERAANAVSDREEWRRLHGPAPAMMEIRFRATGRVQRFSIPSHLKPRKVRGRRRSRGV